VTVYKEIGTGILLSALAAAGWAAQGADGGGAPAGSAPKWEHYAFASSVENLDGPNLEALGTGHGALPTTDSEGNVYFILKYSTCRIRCLRADGWTETIAGDDRWPGVSGLAEGPAAYFPNRWMGPSAGNSCRPGALLTVYGLPLKGEEYGRIYFHWQGTAPYKIFRNKGQNGRWWFKRLGTPGKPKPPTTVGQTVKLEDVDLTGAKVRSGMIAWQGNVYTFDEPKGEMTCSFTLADYEPKVLEMLGRVGRPVGEPEHYIRTDDGYVYLLYYWKTYDVQGQVFRMSPDRKKFERIISDATQRLKGQRLSSNFDGNGLLTTWHCGPADITFSGNTLLTYSIDSTIVRRWVNGRVSSLCRDGEWRENPGRAGGGVVGAGYYQAGHHGNKWFYIFSGVENGNDRTYRFGPVDVAKPTVGPLQEEPKAANKKEEGGEK
jgi:hypothetical protein